MFTKYCRSW